MPNNETVKTNVRMSLNLIFLHQEGKVSIKELNWRYPQFAVRSIYRYGKKKKKKKRYSDGIPVDSKKFNKGRPYKTSIRERILLRTILRLVGFVRVVHCRDAANRKWTYSC